MNINILCRPFEKLAIQSPRWHEEFGCQIRNKGNTRIDGIDELRSKPGSCNLGTATTQFGNDRRHFVFEGTNTRNSSLRDVDKDKGPKLPLVLKCLGPKG